MKKKFTKHLICFLTAFSLLISSILPSFVFETMADNEDNLVKNGSFSSNVSNWSGWDYAWDESMVAIDPYGQISQDITVQKNTTYFWSITGNTKEETPISVDFSIASGSYKPVESVLNVGAGQTKVFTGIFDSGEKTKLKLKITNNNESGIFRCDDIKVHLMKGYTTKQNYSVSDSQSDMGMLITDLLPNTRYVWSFEITEAQDISDAVVSIAGKEVYAGSLEKGEIKSGVFETGDTAPDDDTIQFSTASGTGQYTVSNFNLDVFTNYAMKTDYNLDSQQKDMGRLAISLASGQNYAWSFVMKTSSTIGTVKVIVGGFTLYEGNVKNGTVKGLLETGDTISDDLTIVILSEGGASFTVSNLIITETKSLCTEETFAVSDWGTTSADLYTDLQTGVPYEWSFTFKVSGCVGKARCVIAGEEVYLGEAKQGSVHSGLLYLDSAPANRKVVFSCPNGGGHYTISDFKLKKTILPEGNLLKNPDFDENTADWDTTFQYAVSGGAGNSACVRSRDWNSLSQSVLLKPNTKYTYGFYTGGGGNAKLFIQTENPWSVTDHPVWEGESVSNGYVCGSFTSGQSGKYWFFMRDWGGSGCVFDAFFLIEGEDVSKITGTSENRLINGFFNNDTSYWSGYNFKTQTKCHADTNGVVLDNWGKLYQDGLLLEANTTYTYSFWMKPTDDSTALKLFVLPSSTPETGEPLWKQTRSVTSGFVSGQFKTGSSPNFYVFRFEHMGGSPIYLDTFAVVKGTSYTPPQDGLAEGEILPEKKTLVTDYVATKRYLNLSSDNIIQKGDFETFPEQGVSWNQSGFSDQAVFSIDDTVSYKGSKSLKFTGESEEKTLYLTLPVETNTDYTFACYVRAGYLNADYSGTIKFGLVDEENNWISFSDGAPKHYSSVPEHTAFARDMKWHLVSFEFHTGDQNTITMAFRGNQAVMWFDEMSIAPSAKYSLTDSNKKQTVEPQVYTGIKIDKSVCKPNDNLLCDTSLENADYWDDHNSVRKMISTVKDYRNLKNEVLQYDPQRYLSHSYYTRNIEVEAHTDYTFSSFFRSDAESDVRFGFYYDDGNKDKDIFYISASDDIGNWKFASFKFKTNDHRKITFFILDNGGSFYLDQLYLFKSDKGILFDSESVLKDMNAALTPLFNNKEHITDDTEISDDDQDWIDDSIEPLPDESESKSEEMRYFIVNQKSGIKVYYLDGRAIRNTIQFAVRRFSPQKLDEKVLSILKNYNLAVFDISFIENGKSIEPNGKVCMEIPVPEGFEGENCSVFRIEKDGTVKRVKAVFEDGVIKVVVDRFGVFAIAKPVDSYSWLIIVAISGTLLICATALTIILIAKKKKRRSSNGNI